MEFEIYGKEAYHPKIADKYFNMGLTYKEKNDLELSELFLEKCLQ